MTATVIPFPTRIGGHTARDTAAFIAAGLNPENHQFREHPVRCWECGAETWHVNTFCDRHYQPPGQALHPATRVTPHPRHEGEVQP